MTFWLKPRFHFYCSFCRNLFINSMPNKFIDNLQSVFIKSSAFLNSTFRTFSYTFTSSFVFILNFYLIVVLVKIFLLVNLTKDDQGFLLTNNSDFLLLILISTPSKHIVKNFLKITKVI